MQVYKNVCDSSDTFEKLKIEDFLLAEENENQIVAFSKDISLINMEDQIIVTQAALNTASFLKKVLQTQGSSPHH